MTDVELIMEIKIGIIGYGNQGQRTEKTLKEIGFNVDVIYKPNVSTEDMVCTSDYSKLEECSIIFICSPNDKHFQYIMQFHKNCYIFCFNFFWNCSTSFCNGFPRKWNRKVDKSKRNYANFYRLDFIK